MPVRCGPLSRHSATPDLHHELSAPADTRSESRSTPRPWPHLSHRQRRQIARSETAARKGGFGATGGKSFAAEWLVARYGAAVACGAKRPGIDCTAQTPG